MRIFSLPEMRRENRRKMPRRSQSGHRKTWRYSCQAYWLATLAPSSRCRPGRRHGASLISSVPRSGGFSIGRREVRPPGQLRYARLGRTPAARACSAPWRRSRILRQECSFVIGGCLGCPVLLGAENRARRAFEKNCVAEMSLAPPHDSAILFVLG